MRILMTGVSSFTGFWFARALIDEGHEVTATFTKQPEEYAGLRKARMDALCANLDPVWGCSFGDPKFLEIAGSDNWGAFCHHGAEVTNYRSPEFDVGAALARNTHRISEVMEKLISTGCNRYVATGSVFEGGEGGGSDPLIAFSSYGLSKELSWRVQEYYGARAGMDIGKFVIPNPFGPFEEPRFTAYLLKCWQEGIVAEVKTPEYIRDNIHVSLLARSYAEFLEAPPSCSRHASPSGYVERQGEFAMRFASEMKPRTGLDCEVSLCEQQVFDEPLDRHNMQTVKLTPSTERQAWDSIAEYYAAGGALRAL